MINQDRTAAGRFKESTDRVTEEIPKQAQTLTLEYNQVKQLQDYNESLKGRIVELEQEILDLYRRLHGRM